MHLYKTLKQKKFAEFKKNNLHVVNFSEPVKKIISKQDLLKKIFTHKANKFFIPYVTSYYKKFWGFCMSEKEKKTNCPKESTKYL